MNKSDKTFEEKQNESLPPNISWPDVLEEKLTPSEDTTGKWVASTTSFERKGLRFGMESSPASAEVKGSRQAEERERDREKEKDRKSGEEEVGIRVKTTTREGEHAEQVTKVQKHRCWLEVLRRQLFTCPCCRHWKPCWAWLHGGLESWLQVKQVALHLHCTADRKKKATTIFLPLYKTPSFLCAQARKTKTK